MAQGTMTNSVKTAYSLVPISQAVDCNTVNETCVIRLLTGSTNTPDNRNGILLTCVGIPDQAEFQIILVDAGAWFRRYRWYGNWTTWTQF